MAPPTNTTPATAYEVLLSQLPHLTTWDVDNGAGVAVTVYFKFTNDLGRDAVVTWWYYSVIGTNPAVNYVPDHEAFADIGISTMVYDAYPNCATEVPIKAGQSYWIRVRRYGAGNANATLNINVSLKPYSTIFPAGQIVIFAASADAYFISQGGLHAGFINPSMSTPATRIVNFIPFFPAVEFGDISVLGTRYLLGDWAQVTQPPPVGNNEHLLLYNQQFVLQSRVTFPGPGVGANFIARIRTCLGTDKFWIGSPGHSGAPNRYANVTQAGALSSVVNLLTFTTGAATLSCCAALNDESYLLVLPSSTSNNYAHKWNLNTLAWDGSIGSAVANHNPSDILVLQDNTIVIMYEQTSPDFRSATYRRYSLAGALLNTATITTSAPVSFSAAPRIGYARDRAYFWVWGPRTDGMSILRKVRASDFTNTVDVLVPNVQETDDEISNPSLIYVSDSCPVIETYVSALSGILVMEPNPPFVPGQPRRDVYPDQERKIPNPTVRTALIGD